MEWSAERDKYVVVLSSTVMEIVLLNDKVVSTCQRWHGETWQAGWPCLASQVIKIHVIKIESSKVIEEVETLSDHRYIMLNLYKTKLCRPGRGRSRILPAQHQEEDGNCPLLNRW